MDLHLVNRRRFLQTSAATLGVAAMPAWLKAEDKKDERFGPFTIVLGQAVIYVVSGATATHWAGGSTAVAAVASCWPARGGAPSAGPGPGSGTPPGGAR